MLKHFHLERTAGGSGRDLYCISRPGRPVSSPCGCENAGGRVSTQVRAGLCVSVWGCCEARFWIFHGGSENKRYFHESQRNSSISI